MSIRDNMEDVLDYVTDLRDLKDDWDGYGAGKPSEEVIFAVHNLLKTAHFYIPNIPLPYIFPNPAGSILIDWDYLGGSLEVTIHSEKSMDLVIDEGHSRVCKEYDSTEFGDIVNFLQYITFRGYIFD